MKSNFETAGSSLQEKLNFNLFSSLHRAVTLDYFNMKIIKSNFSQVLAVGFLFSVPTWAQPNVAPAETMGGPRFNLGDSNMNALSLIGAFYNKMARSGSYRGRVTTVKNLIRDGKIVSTRSSAIQSSWIADEKKTGAVSKEVTDIVYTVTLDNKTTVEKLSSDSDGTKNYRFYSTKNVWTERKRDINDATLPLVITRAAWTTALMNFAVGKEFKIENKTVDGQNSIVIDMDAENRFTNRYIFDASNGNLRSLTLSNADETTEFQWLDTEFDVPLADSLFQWKAPEGSKQVAPESVSVKMDL